jgi:uncharacterized protein (TIGR02722 family)
MNGTSKQFKLFHSTSSILAGALLASSFAGGCADTHARRVETGGPETITTVDQIDDQDWAEAANKATTNMLSQPGLFAVKDDGSKHILAISRIINNTSQIVDTDLLVKQIRVTLNRSGKVITQTTDQGSSEAADVKHFMEDKDKVQADYRLSGKLIQTHANAGDVRQNTFHFQLSLTDKDGNDIWEGDTPITKIGSHNSVGI